MLARLRVLFLFLFILSFAHQASYATTVSDLSASLEQDVSSVSERARDLYSIAANNALFSIGDTTVTSIDLVWVVLVFLIAGIVSKVLRGFLRRLAQKHDGVSASGMFTVGKLLHYLLVLIAVFVSFSLLGIDYTKLAIVAGALSVGVGFGLQSIFNNFISGLILLFERPIKVGDLIELSSGTRGRVKAINVRSTRITTWDNIDVLVPNSEFISGKVTNYTLSDDMRRLHIPFGVAYGSDKSMVQQAVIEASLELRCTINHGDHKPDVWLINFGDSSLDFELIVWVKGNDLPSDKHPIGMYLWEIETKLAEYGIEIPFPQRDLRLRSIDKEAVDMLPTA